jgi:hypothetical protein
MLRLWDLFLSDHSKIATTTVYLCAAMVAVLAPRLIGLGGPEFVMSVQSVSVDFWTMEDLETILAQAYVYEKAAARVPGHA